MSPSYWKRRRERLLRRSMAGVAGRERKRMASLALRGAGEIGGDRLVARTLEAKVTVERPGRCREVVEAWAEEKGDGRWRRWVTINGVRCRWIRTLGGALRAVGMDVQ